MIWLDTNAVIACLNVRPPLVRARLRAALAAGEQIGLSAIALFQLAYAAQKTTHHARNEAALAAFLSLDIEQTPFTPTDAREAGTLRAELERAATPIGHYDLLIAAHARRNQACLVTNNTREFARIPGLTITDWTAP